MELSISRFLQFQRQCAQIYAQRMGRAAESCGLTRPEADVLIFLANNPTYQTARDVALYRGFSKAYVSRAVDALQKRRLLQVEPSPTDRRFQTLCLTEAAAEPVAVLRRAQETFAAQLTRDIPSADSAVALGVMERMMDNVASLRQEA